MVEGAEEVIALTHLANAYRDQYRFEEARSAASCAVECANTLRLHRDGINAKSTLGQILVASGRASEGLPLVKAARDFYDTRRASECPRNHTYLVEALLRTGDLKEALREHQLGLEHNQQRGDPQGRRFNRLYLDYALLNGQLRLLRHDPDASVGRWNALYAETLRALDGFEQPWKDSPWPLPALRRVRDAAALRTVAPADQADILIDVRHRMEVFREQPLFAWHGGMLLLEAATVDLSKGGAVEAGRELALEGLAPAIANNGCFFEPWCSRVESSSSGEELGGVLVEVLEAEQY